MIWKTTLTAITAFIFSLNVLSQNGVTIVDSINSGGLQRKFRLYVPNSYNGSTSVPLILNLHGYTSNALQQQLYANFMPVADTAKFLVVHPDGTTLSTTTTQYWNAGFGGTVNDVQFLSQLIDTIMANYNIDANAVYSCGMSNGGIMSYYLAINLSNRIAAIASVTGAMINFWPSTTPMPARPFPILEIHGTADATVPYNGDGTFAPTDSTVKKWRMYNNCNPTPITYSVPNINTSDNSTVVNYRYTGGTNGAEVELYKVTGGSHSWPGGANVIANTNQDFSATVEIWRFFRKYKLNQFTSSVGIAEQKTSSDKVRIHPNPATDYLILELPGAPISDYTIEIQDLAGRQVLYYKNQKQLNIQTLQNGVYLVKVVQGNSIFYTKLIKSN